MMDIFEKMIAERIGSGEEVHYELSSYSTEKIHWVNRKNKQSDEASKGRNSNPKNRKFIYPGPFSAAGKLYLNWNQLRAKVGPKDEFYKDTYGRKVFEYCELFPCFDSYDYLHENRFYRWYFILENGILTRIHHTDTSAWIHVTEDVDGIECMCWDEMIKSGFLIGVIIYIIDIHSHIILGIDDRAESRKMI